MQSRTLKRRFGGVLGTLTVLLILLLGAYGALNGYVLDAWPALSTMATILIAVLVFGFVALLSASGSRGGGWLDTPYW